jgi:hypothetical protein
MDITYTIETIEKGLFVIHTSDGRMIPPDDGNADYRAYLAWVAEGNTAEPWNDTPTEITPPPA